MDATKDHLERRCPRLGGTVSFQYCKISGDDNRPCWKTIDCWWEYFDVLSYLKENLPENEFNMLLNVRPKPKISSIVDLIEQAKKRIA